MKCAVTGNALTWAAITITVVPVDTSVRAERSARAALASVPAASRSVMALASTRAPIPQMVAVAVQLAFVLAGYVCRENGYFRGGYYLPWVYLYRRDQSMIGRERCVGGA